MGPLGRFSLVRIIGGTRGAGNCAVLKKVAAFTVSTRILKPVSSLFVQSLPDLADRTMFAMMMVEEGNRMTFKQPKHSPGRVFVLVVRLCSST